VKEEAVRFSTMALTGLLLLGGVALAEPPKAEPKLAQADSPPRPATIVLASAEPVRPGAEAPPAPVKRRIVPRVTSCRCGDQQSERDPDYQR
jgi:hypothetical protein